MSTPTYCALGVVTVASNGVGKGLRVELFVNGNGHTSTESPKELRELASALTAAARTVELSQHPPPYKGLHACGATEYCHGCEACHRWIGPGPHDLACKLRHEND